MLPDEELEIPLAFFKKASELNIRNSGLPENRTLKLRPEGWVKISQMRMGVVLSADYREIRIVETKNGQVR